MLYRYLWLLLLAGCSVAGAEQRVMLILGDSLSAGYGMPLEASWVSELRQRLIQQEYNYTIINASISGETTRGGAVRLPGILADNRVDIAIIALGGNDGLRGISLLEIETNLRHIIETLQAAGCEVVLVQMQLPPNYGAVYNSRFREIYSRLAASHAIQLTRFVMEELIARPDLMQADRLHPTAKAQLVMLNNVWDDIQPLLKRPGE